MLALEQPVVTDIGRTYTDSGAVKINRADRVVLSASLLSGYVIPANTTIAWAFSAVPTAQFGTVSYGTEGEKLLILGNQLAEGREYALTSTVTQSTYFWPDLTPIVTSAQSEFRITVNSPPGSGSCAVTPTEGIMLSTKFEIVCKDWVDDDIQNGEYDLRYSYQVYVNNEETANLQFKSRSNYKSGFTLPKGYGLDSEVNVVATITDQLGAQTVVTVPVKVTDALDGADAAATDAFFEGATDDLESLLQTGDASTALATLGDLANLLGLLGRRRLTVERMLGLASTSTGSSLSSKDVLGNSLLDRTLDVLDGVMISARTGTLQSGIATLAATSAVVMHTSDGGSAAGHNATAMAARLLRCARMADSFADALMPGISLSQRADATALSLDVQDAVLALSNLDPLYYRKFLTTMGNLVERHRLERTLGTLLEEDSGSKTNGVAFFKLLDELVQSSTVKLGHAVVRDEDLGAQAVHVAGEQQYGAMSLVVAKVQGKDALASDQVAPSMATALASDGATQSMQSFSLELDSSDHDSNDHDMTSDHDSNAAQAEVPYRFALAEADAATHAMFKQGLVSVVSTSSSLFPLPTAFALGVRPGKIMPELASRKMTGTVGLQLTELTGIATLTLPGHTDEDRRALTITSEGFNGTHTAPSVMFDIHLGDALADASPECYMWNQSAMAYTVVATTTIPGEEEPLEGEDMDDDEMPLHRAIRCMLPEGSSTPVYVVAIDTEPDHCASYSHCTHPDKHSSKWGVCYGSTKRCLYAGTYMPTASPTLAPTTAAPTKTPTVSPTVVHVEPRAKEQKQMSQQSSGGLVTKDGMPATSLALLACAVAALLLACIGTAWHSCRGKRNKDGSEANHSKKVRNKKKLTVYCGDDEDGQDAHNKKYSSGVDPGAPGASSTGVNTGDVVTPYFTPTDANTRFNNESGADGPRISDIRTTVHTTPETKRKNSGGHEKIQVESADEDGHGTKRSMGAHIAVEVLPSPKGVPSPSDLESPFSSPESSPEEENTPKRPISRSAPPRQWDQQPRRQSRYPYGAGASGVISGVHHLEPLDNAPQLPGSPDIAPPRRNADTQSDEEL
jgi:hypothetical protein